MEVGAVWDRVAHVDADAKANAAVGRLVTVIDRHLLLHPDSAPHCTVDAVERDQQGISAGLHHPAAVIADCGVDERAPKGAKAAQGAGIVDD